MNNDHHEEDLLERGLAAWEAPQTPIGLTDRILAHNADALAGLAQPAPQDAQPPQESEPIPMHPTQPRISSSARPFWTATLVGFAAAAALLLAFTAGRESTSAPQVAPQIKPVIPKVEIQVTAPPPAAPTAVSPPTPPAPPAVPEAAPVPPEPNTTEPPQPPPTLKDPFGDPARKPQSKPKSKPGSDRVIYMEETSRNLKNPFSDDGEKSAVLRIGTTAGTMPARVFVDGVEIGSTPLARHDVTPGRHKIKFVWSSGKTETKYVTVKAGKNAMVRGG